MQKVWHKVVKQSKSSFRSGMHWVDLSPMLLNVGSIIWVEIVLIPLNVDSVLNYDF